MFKPSFLVYLDGPQFKADIQSIAEAQKVDIHFATQGDQLSQLVKTYAPFFMLVDLSGLDAGWIFRHISIIKNSKPNFSICALVNDDQENVGSRAEKYGCDRIITKSKLIEELPELIEYFLRKP